MLILFLCSLLTHSSQTCSIWKTEWPIQPARLSSGMSVLFFLNSKFRPPIHSSSSTEQIATMWWPGSTSVFCPSAWTGEKKVLVLNSDAFTTSLVMKACFWRRLCFLNRQGLCFHSTKQNSTDDGCCASCRSEPTHTSLHTGLLNAVTANKPTFSKLGTCLSQQQTATAIMGWRRGQTKLNWTRC